jgi:hypothetical protein
VDERIHIPGGGADRMARAGAPVAVADAVAAGERDVTRIREGAAD